MIIDNDELLENMNTLCNIFSDISALLSVLGRGAETQAEYLDIDMLRKFNMEMSYSLYFVSESMKVYSETLWGILNNLKKILPSTEEEENNKKGTKYV